MNRHVGCRTGRGRGDRGVTTIAATFMLLIVLAGGGLIFDGGRALAARADAFNNAEAAARAGSLELTQQGLDSDAAEQTARDYLTSVGVAPEDVLAVEVSGSTVRVVVQARVEAAFAALLGEDTLVVTGDGEATADIGQFGS